eukprot:TRINITY_DN1959_c0_g1_i2.p1 TRINITY_DN1959_c0_g1~~TRINITY_DN1959_c0_g1_i2.p1  ORF type:complete len:281 (+),score=104.21 TRINITY_DN1959_c0_g1_i2:111-953(+)
MRSATLSFVLLLCTAFSLFQCSQVMVPGGYLLDSEQVKEVPNGSLLVYNETSSLLQILDSEMRILSEEIMEQFEGKSVQKRDTGWVNSAWQMGRRQTEFTASWTVPQRPASLADRQTLFYFNSWENQINGISQIVQPVLQWGVSAAGGDHNSWKLGSWWVTSNHQAKYSPLTTVNPGDKIVGTISYSDPQTISIKCFVNGKMTANLSIRGTGVYDSAQVASEVYFLNTCKDYPPGPFSFDNMRLRDSGNVVTSPWRLQKGPTSHCGTIKCPSVSTCTINY